MGAVGSVLRWSVHVYRPVRQERVTFFSVTVQCILPPLPLRLSESYLLWHGPETMLWKALGRRRGNSSDLDRRFKALAVKLLLVEGEIWHTSAVHSFVGMPLEQQHL